MTELEKLKAEEREVFMKRKINPIPPDDPSYPFDDYNPNREWYEEERRLILMLAGKKNVGAVRRG